MQIHADLSKRAVVNSNELPWVESPLVGVQRRMLERDGGEMATRATTIVRYQPDSYFNAHTHTGGEEYLVLDGIFSDEMGDFHQGMYVRNPVGSKHKPYTRKGTTILVKLQQFDADDQEYVRINTPKRRWLLGPVDGVKRYLFCQAPLPMNMAPTRKEHGYETLLVVNMLLIVKKDV